ncbi:MAG TPA: hypothetical protein VFG07_06690 [Thermoplasmata archaeon]|nr:hypothetical protein [Thermoplasmata archaeon]
MTYSWGNLWRLPYARPDAGRAQRSGIATLLLFATGALVFAAVTIGVEVALGHPLLPPNAPGVSPSLADALWHLASAFLIALPARRWVTLWLAPALALGLDIDHVFGDVLPTVTGRTDHDVLFVLAIGVVLYVLQGRSAALLASGAVLAHIAVDGGAFPFFGPASVTFFAPPLPVLLVMLGAAAGLFYLAGRDWKELWRPTHLASVAAAGFAVGALFLYLPLVASVIGQ